jgi:hypothetical protein
MLDTNPSETEDRRDDDAVVEERGVENPCECWDVNRTQSRMDHMLRVDAIVMVSL